MQRADLGRRVAVGVDIGGTKLASGLVSADGTVLARTRTHTPADDADAIADLVIQVAGQLTEEGATGRCPVGVGAAGMVDLDGVIRYAPNVRWRDEPLRERLETALGVPVSVDNDANVAAWGEFSCGAGRDARSSMVMLTIGTGVGGGLVMDGHLLRGAHGLAAEMGHLVIAEGGPPCPCGNRGCLEALASGTAIGRSATLAREAGDMPASSVLARQTGDITGKDVTLAAQEGDEAARALLGRAGFWLGVGIASLVNTFDPEVVVVGGGAIQAGDLLLGPARVASAERVMGRAHRRLPEIRAAALGDDAGIVGAALLGQLAAATRTPAG